MHQSPLGIIDTFVTLVAPFVSSAIKACPLSMVWKPNSPSLISETFLILLLKAQQNCPLLLGFEVRSTWSNRASFGCPSRLKGAASIFYIWANLGPRLDWLLVLVTTLLNFPFLPRYLFGGRPFKLGGPHNWGLNKNGFLIFPSSQGGNIGLGQFGPKTTGVLPNTPFKRECVPLIKVSRFLS